MGPLGFERHWYFVLLAAGIGTVTAVVAWAFIWLIHLAADLFEHAPSEHLWWIILVLPMVGALIAGAIIYFVAAEARGHGVPEGLELSTEE